MPICINKERRLKLICKTDGKFVGIRSGQTSNNGQQRTWFNISCVMDGEPYNLPCMPEVFNKATGLEFGHDLILHIDLRQFGRDWYPRVVDFE